MIYKYNMEETIPQPTPTLTTQPTPTPTLTTQPTPTPITLNYSLCGCYNKYSYDSRCCGLCYCIKRNKMNKVKYMELYKTNQCHICPRNIYDYTESIYFNTCDDCLCTAFCCPIKFPLFYLCFLGSICNHCVNCCLETDHNFLF